MFTENFSSSNGTTNLVYFVLCSLVQEFYDIFFSISSFSKEAVPQFYVGLMYSFQWCSGARRVSLAQCCQVRSWCGRALWSCTAYPPRRTRGDSKPWVNAKPAWMPARSPLFLEKSFSSPPVLFLLLLRILRTRPSSVEEDPLQRTFLYRERPSQRAFLYRGRSFVKEFPLEEVPSQRTFLYKGSPFVGPSPQLSQRWRSRSSRVRRSGGYAISNHAAKAAPGQKMANQKVFRSGNLYN